MMEPGMPAAALRSATPPLARQGGLAAPVRRILVINGKGGCGKTTIATNLASYYARQGRGIALIDHDPQGSSMQWLSLRSTDAKSIHGVTPHRPVVSGVTRSFLMRIPDTAERVVLDAPAGVQGHQLIELVRQIDVILIPVLPSPIDIHAASRFIQDLLLVAKVRARNIRVGVVANRVRENTKVYHSLEKFLNSLNIPVVARLRDTQNYVRAAELGVGVHDLGRAGAHQDQRQWEALIRWLEQP